MKEKMSFGITNIAVGGMITLGIEQTALLKLPFETWLWVWVGLTAVSAFTLGRVLWEKHFE